MADIFIVVSQNTELTHTEAIEAVFLTLDDAYAFLTGKEQCDILEIEVEGIEAEGDAKPAAAQSTRAARLVREGEQITTVLRGSDSLSDPRD